MVLALVLALLLGLIVRDDLAIVLFVFLWVGLFFGWPYLSRKLGFPNFPSAPAPRKPRPPAPKRPFGIRLLRGTFVTVGKIALALFLLCLLPSAPLFVSYCQARRAHDTVRVGMTTPEVLHSVTGWNFMFANSEFPHAHDEEIPAVNLNHSDDGGYLTYDLAAGRDRHLSAEEAVALFHEKLHDGYGWRFRYTYINITPQHVSFSVVFGPLGRVTEVKPVYGWD